MEASKNIYSVEHFDFEFHKVSELISHSYKEISENEQFVYTKINNKYWVVLENGKEKPEEYIRNVFLDKKYMQNKKLKRKFDVSDLEFKPEVGENRNRKTIGSHDIQVLGLAQKLFGEADEDIYFSIECKRLNQAGQSTEKYVNEGIGRYTTTKYSEKMPLAAMLAFVEDSAYNYPKEINNTLKTHQSIVTECYLTLRNSGENVYNSKHLKSSDGKIISLYHFFFEFVNNIKKITQ